MVRLMVYIKSLPVNAPAAITPTTTRLKPSRLALHVRDHAHFAAQGLQGILEGG